MAKDDEALAVMMDILQHEVSNTGIDTNIEQVFRRDLIEVMRVKTSSDEFEWAPYVKRYDLKKYAYEAQAKVNFPNGEYYSDANQEAAFLKTGPSLSVLVRCLDQEGRASQWYSVPIIVDERMPLDASDVLERKIGRFRLGEHFLKDADRLQNDKLTNIVRRLHEGKKLITNDEDLFVDMMVKQLLGAYEEEDNMKFDGTEVQKVTIVMPVNPDVYRTEMVGLVSQKKDDWSEDMCFAYGAGNIFYRGRPIVSKKDHPRFLTDSDKAGKDCYFTVESLFDVTSAAQSGAVVKDIHTGNLVVIAMPLVGERPPPVYSHPPSERSMTMGLSRGFKDIDLAVLSTGSRTGGSSQLVPRAYDKRRKSGIIDARLLTLSPNNRTPEAVKAFYS